jgi:hypothetical protein
MTTLVVHESMFGNTRTIARAIGAALPGPVVTVDVGDAPSPLPSHVDLLVVGGPTHAFSMSRSSTRHDAVAQGAAPDDESRGIREWLNGLPPTPHVSVATFDTRVDKVRRLPGSAARSASKVVARRRLGRVVGVESFYVDGVDGPLLDGEVERAGDWARSLAQVIVGGVDRSPDRQV